MTDEPNIIPVEPKREVASLLGYKTKRRTLQRAVEAKLKAQGLLLTLQIDHLANTYHARIYRNINDSAIVEFVGARSAGRLWRDIDIWLYKRGV